MRRHRPSVGQMAPAALALRAPQVQAAVLRTSPLGTYRARTTGGFVFLQASSSGRKHNLKIMDTLQHRRCHPQWPSKSRRRQSMGFSQLSLPK
mmetsp:Transcript_124462/g.359875  ORF Transcript_124462/g.359875 Transcript_124462/m.359875 type:complete len:93 (+) Transcript_124462:1281-1559(+)